jgi:bifunctional non-homologous end joining protein LigD
VFHGNELVYIGHSGGGFTTKVLQGIHQKLEPLIQNQCPFPMEPKTNTPATWVKPELVCEVAFTGWTDDAVMRHPVFLRMREDKAAGEVVINT